MTLNDKYLWNFLDGEDSTYGKGQVAQFSTGCCCCLEKQNKLLPTYVRYLNH